MQKLKSSEALCNFDPLCKIENLIGICKKLAQIFFFDILYPSLPLLLSLILEVGFKTFCSHQGVGYSDIYLYLGAGLEDLNEEPWLITSSLILTAAIAVAMGVHRIVKLK